MTKRTLEDWILERSIADDISSNSSSNYDSNSYMDYELDLVTAKSKPFEFEDLNDLIAQDPNRKTKYLQEMPMQLFKSINLRFKYSSTGLNTWDLETSSTRFEILQVNNMNTLSLSNNSAPAAWKSWTNFYQAYITKWVQISVTFINNSNYPVYVGIAFRPVAEIGGATWNNLRATVTNTFPNKQLLLSAKGGKKDNTTLTVSCNLANLWGLPTQHTSDTRFASLTDGQPQQNQQAIIFALFNTDDSAPGPCIINYNLKLEFLTTMFQNKLLVGT